MSPIIPVPSFRCPLSFMLSCLLAVQGLAGRAPYQAQAPAKLNIVIVEGEGAINNIRQRVAREPIVQVTDENNRPVAGATVVFFLPKEGPGGTFPGGARNLSVVTGSDGRAVARGLRTNDVAGKFQIQVEATYQGVSATATITQSNAVLAAAAGGISGKLLAIFAIAGGAAAGGVIAATRGGKETAPPPPTPTTVSAGTPSVGAP